MSIVSNSNLERYVGKQKEWAENRYDLTTNCNYQLTEKASEVSFYPTGNSPLDCTVDFMFTETPPASGEKSPDNPSTIIGVNSLTITRGHVRGILENSYTIDLGGTYYGGSIDLATGLMTVTHTRVVLDGTETWYGGAQNSNQGYHGFACYVPSGPANLTQVCTHFVYSNSLSTAFQHFVVVGPGIHFYTTQETTTEFNTWLADQYTSGTPVTIGYTLTTPYIVQLTPTQIFSLTQPDKYTPRLNTVYSTGTLVQVGYRKSPIREEYEIQQAIASLGGI